MTQMELALSREKHEREMLKKQHRQQEEDLNAAREKLKEILQQKIEMEQRTHQIERNENRKVEELEDLLD